MVMSRIAVAPESQRERVLKNGIDGMFVAAQI